MQVLDLFSAEEQAHIIHRLGYLNVWNPLKVDGGIQLCLTRREEVGPRCRTSEHCGNEVTNQNLLAGGCVPHPCAPRAERARRELAGAAVAPQPPCATHPRYHLSTCGFGSTSTDASSLTAWTLNLNWLKEDTYGDRGYLSVYYFSGAGMGLRGCAPNVKLRIALSLLTLADAPLELIYEYYPALVDKPWKEIDAFFKQVIVDDLRSQQISFKYNIVQTPPT
jgi:hypothetical protein